MVLGKSKLSVRLVSGASATAMMLTSARTTTARTACTITLMITGWN
ncbi:hypothetical protein [Ruminococcus sp.]|nr:hypothetical protein [Ruminococcus sp.]MBQ8967141.1 hypothetical protein [Ruminococcus sp.]